MLKNILNLEGAKALNKKEQQLINGGWFEYCGDDNGDLCDTDQDCPLGDCIQCMSTGYDKSFKFCDVNHAD